MIFHLCLRTSKNEVSSRLAGLEWAVALREKHKRRRPIEIPRSRWEDNITRRMDFKEIGVNAKDWVDCMSIYTSVGQLSFARLTDHEEI